MKKNTSKTIINSILWVLSIVWIFPAVFAIMGSLKNMQEYNLSNFWELPKSLGIAENWEYITQTPGIIGGLFNSGIYALSGALFSTIIALLAAYAIAHLKIKHRLFWFLFIYSGTIFPFQVYLVPVYVGLSSVGLYDSRLGMILFYSAICVPFSMFVLRNYFIDISKEICESAKIDGASDLRILGNIFVPMAKAPLAVVFLSQFTWIWNDLMFGLTFTKTPEVRPIMASISLMGKARVPAIMLVCILASIPTLLLFRFLQKHFAHGFAYQSK